MGKSVKALVIAPQPFFSPRGTPFSVYYRTLVTAEQGVEVDLLTYGEGQDVDIPGVRIIRIPRLPFCGPVKVGPSVLKLFLDVLILVWAIALLASRRYSFVHAHEESVFFCRFLKPIFRFKLVYDMHSSLPQQLTNFQFTTSRSLIRLFERLEASCLSAADAVITICPALAEYAVSKMPDPRRHFLIENSIFEPVRLSDPPSEDAGTSALPPIPGDRAVVAYVGTFESYQGLDILIPAFAIVRERRPDAFLLLVGGSPTQVDRARELAEECGLSGHCLFTGRVDQGTAGRLLGAASVLTSPRSQGTNTPLKIYELLDCGKPLVATRIHSHTQVLSDEVCFLVDPTPQSMAGGILNALADDDRVRDLVTRARQLYARSYSRAAYVSKMERLLEVLS